MSDMMNVKDMEDQKDHPNDEIVARLIIIIKKIVNQYISIEKKSSVLTILIMSFTVLLSSIADKEFVQRLLEELLQDLDANTKKTPTSNWPSHKSESEFEFWINDQGLIGTRPKTADGCPRWLAEQTRLKLMKERIVADSLYEGDIVLCVPTEYDDGPHRLVSLWDMLKIYAHQYFNAGRDIEEMLMLLEEDASESGGLKPDDVADLKRMLGNLSRTCDQLGLKIAKSGIDRAISRPPETSRELQAVVSVVTDELKNQLFLFVPSERASLYQSDPKVPAFPLASSELIRAGNCFAVAEYTASVFHSMRAVELGLDAVRTNLGLAARNISQRSWGNTCNDIRDAISAKGNAWPKLDKYTAIHATLVSVKDSWRNQTMHVATSYDEDQSRLILSNTQAFIVRLSVEMDEHGQPPA